VSAFGGIGIECSTYSPLRTRPNEFAILRGAELAFSDRFQFLKRYGVTFMPTLVATAAPGGPVERKPTKPSKPSF
jgi:microcystin degradation protein MlrC